MPGTLFFITHPEVVVDGAVPVTAWPLSGLGRRRAAIFASSGLLAAVTRVFSSDERKAREAAEVLAAPLALSVDVRAELGENDRRSTGFLERAPFEAAADEFFRNPTRSFRGWETAAAAQRRIVAAIERIIATGPLDADTAVVSHGAVGTLLKCQLKGVPISRAEDQTRQGNFYRVDQATRRLLHDWVPLPEG